MWMMVIPVLAIIIYFIFRKHETPWNALVWKTASSMGFLILAFMIWYTKGSSTYAMKLLSGLVLGALGDILLAFMFCKPKQKQFFFLGGLTAFLLGHLCYVAAFYHTTAFIGLLFGFLCVVIGFIMILLLTKMGIDFEEMKWAALVYAIVILCMELQAVTLLFVELTPFTILLNIGTLSFVISDLILVFILFGNKNTYQMNCWNLSCYYAAQLLLILTMHVNG